MKRTKHEIAWHFACRPVSKGQRTYPYKWRGECQCSRDIRTMIEPFFWLLVQKYDAKKEQKTF